MTATDTIDEVPPEKRSKRGLFIGVILALLVGGGAFFTTNSGMFTVSETAASGHKDEQAEKSKPLPKTAFLPLDPLVVTIRSSSKYRLLRFSAQLEVPKDALSEVTQLQPRIVDVMNTYLNALKARHFEDPIAMLKLRAQLLRRIQIVTGTGRVNDLLIMEFMPQ